MVMVVALAGNVEMRMVVIVPGDGSLAGDELLNTLAGMVKLAVRPGLMVV